MVFAFRAFSLWTLSLFMLICFGGLAIGCAGARPSTPIHEAAIGTVFLENVPDKSFQAAHPIKLSETTVADIKRKNQTKEKTNHKKQQGKTKKTTNLNDIRTFSEDDIAYL